MPVKKKARKKSSSIWLNRQKRDPYVRQAQQAGYRSRASFKLLELHQANKLFKPGMCIVDLGAAPGGWSQVLASLVGKKGQIYALDLLDMPPIPGVTFLHGDFTCAKIQQKITENLAGFAVHWVISDMAPNLSGVRDIDHPKMMALAEEAWAFAKRVLAPNGGFLVKLFQGEAVKPFIQEIKPHFKEVVIRKPGASRAESSEVYLLAQGYKKELDR